MKRGLERIGRKGQKDREREKETDRESTRKTGVEEEAESYLVLTTQATSSLGENPDLPNSATNWLNDLAKLLNVSEPWDPSQNEGSTS